MPEVEETEAVADEIYIVAGDVQEYKAFLRAFKQYRTNNTHYVGSLDRLRNVRKALVIFTGSWELRPDGVDLWELANAGGNAVKEQFVL